MDPLSIIASTIAIATPITLGLRNLRNVRQAKNVLLLLANEVSEIVVLLQELDQVLRQQTARVPLPNPRLLQILHAAHTKLKELSSQISEWSSDQSAQSGPKKPHPVIWLLITSKTKLFKDELQKIRFQLMTVLSMLNLSGSARVEMSLQDVLLITRDTAHRQLSAQNELRNDLSRKYEEIDARLSILTINRRAEDAAAVQAPVYSTPAVDPTDANGGFNSVAEGTRIKAFHHNGSVLFDSAQMTAVTAVGIRAIQFPRTSCTPWCSCSCHRESSFRTPRFLEQFIGSLFIGYSGLPVLRPRCNERTCHLRAQPLTYVTYFFPKWFLSRMVTFMMTVTPLAGPVASLKVQRTVPGNADIFTFAKLGNVDGIRTLFENGFASPHDVHFESGITPLHMAINHQHINVCKFLLQSNADPFLSDFTRCSSADSAWTKILSRCLAPSAESILRDLFSETECVERRDFTILHKIVLGMLDIDLDLELRGSTAEIDMQDTIGRTALSMAAERSEITHVNTLLSHGANAELASYSDQTSLHYAAAAKSPECIRLLLEAGVKVDCLTNWNQTPLHLAAAYIKDARHATLLLEAGGDVNFRDRDGMTPLGWTAISNNVPIASVLLDHDADAHDPDLQGSSTLQQCIRSNRHEILQLLVPKRIRVKDCFAPDQMQKNVWSVIAANADVETMHILRQMDFTDVLFEEEPVADGSVGNNNPELGILSTRSDCSDDLIDAFQGLVREVRMQREENNEIESDEEEEDLWEDAQERL